MYNFPSYLRIPGFLGPEETNVLLNRARQLLDEFNVDEHPLVAPFSSESDWTRKII